ncbi:MAG: hypothetical protein HKN53_12820 [Maribacter sp.]|nr:hypothetical protein [Maribacter sp.]
MLLKKEKWIKDEELGFLKANPSIFMTSGIKWKKRIDFLGMDVDVLVSGNLEKLNKTETKIMTNALNNIKLIEKQVLYAIHDLCLRNNIKSDAWESYFRCFQIYIEKADLFILIEDTVNYLTYELELKWF